MVSIAAEEWMKQGRSEGLAKGMAQGETDALSAVLTDILESRFGPLDSATHRRIGRLSTAGLYPATRRAATCARLDEAFGDDAFGGCVRPGDLSQSFMSLCRRRGWP